MLDKFIEAIPAQQRTGKSWFTRLGRRRLPDASTSSPTRSPSIVCIFGGDHIYKMDVRQMLDAHLAAERRRRRSRRSRCRATRRATFGVIEIDEDGRIIAFHEKVEEPADDARVDPTCAWRRWATTSSTPTTLIDELERDAAHRDAASTTSVATSSRAWSQTGRRVFVYDFAKNVVPGEDERERGYWRDVGTIDAYWDAQMDLVAIHPLFNLYNTRWPIRTGMTHDPPAKFVFRDEAHARVGIATDSLVIRRLHHLRRAHPSQRPLASACRINSFSEVEESVLFESVSIGRHAKHPPLHHRQGRRDPAGRRDRLRPRGGPQALLRQRRRHRRHPEARQVLAARRRAV